MIKRPLSKLIKDIIAVQNRAGVEKSVLILQGKGAEKPIFQNQVPLSVIFRQPAVQNPAMSTEPKDYWWQPEWIMEPILQTPVSKEIQP